MTDRPLGIAASSKPLAQFFGVNPQATIQADQDSPGQAIGELVGLYAAKMERLPHVGPDGNQRGQERGLAFGFHSVGRPPVVSEFVAC